MGLDSYVTEFHRTLCLPNLVNAARQSHRSQHTQRCISWKDDDTDKTREICNRTRRTTQIKYLSSAANSGPTLLLPYLISMVNINRIRIDPPIINTSCAWASEFAQLEELYNSPYTGAVTTRTATLSGFAEDSSHAVCDLAHTEVHSYL